jgi:hypothetical protein
MRKDPKTKLEHSNFEGVVWAKSTEQKEIKDAGVCDAFLSQSLSRLQGKREREDKGKENRREPAGPS